MAVYYSDEEKTQALQAAHDAVCESLSLNSECDSSPVAYNGPMGLEPWHTKLWTDEMIEQMIGPDSELTPTNI